MHNLCDLRNIRVKEADGIGIGEHQTCRIITNGCF